MNYTGERFIPDQSNDSAMSMQHWHRYKAIHSLIKGKRVLDIACGEGYGAYYLSEFAKEVVAVDIDSKAIKEASSKYQGRDNLQFDISDLTNDISKSYGVFDVIVSFETFEHVDEQAQQKFLQICQRSLTEDGLLVLSTPNKYYFNKYESHDNQFHIKEYEHGAFEILISTFFKFTTFYGQKVEPVSSIFPLMVKVGLTECFELKKINLEDKENFTYSIVLASNFKKYKIKPSFLHDYSDGWRENKVSSTLYLGYVSEFKQENSISCMLEYTKHKVLNVIYNIDDLPTNFVRFDPSEEPCIVRFETIRYVTSDSEVFCKIEDILREGNFVDDDKGAYKFLTSDPIMIFSFPKEIIQLELKFSYEKIDYALACRELNEKYLKWRGTMNQLSMLLKGCE